MAEKVFITATQCLKYWTREKWTENNVTPISLDFSVNYCIEIFIVFAPLNDDKQNQLFCPSLFMGRRLNDFGYLIKAPRHPA
jgi:hypothetical protein